MTCNEYQELISQLVDDELDDGQSSELFLHTGRCAECRAFLRSTLRLRNEIASQALATPLSFERVDAHVRIRLRRTRMQHRPFRTLFVRRISVPIPVAAALGILLIIGSILLASLSTREHDPQVVYIMGLPTIEVQELYPAKK